MSTTARFTAADCRLEDLLAVLEQTADLRDYPHATALEREVLLYDAPRLIKEAETAEGRLAIQAELARALSDGPGVVVLKGAYEDLEVVDGATAAFLAMIAEQRASGAASGDHFAKAGANDRVWNALEKLALAEPDVFAAYYANDAIALIATAWLGPAYQVTSQINVVNPGGAAQEPHRDYHLGFMADARAELFPAHVHLLSPVLTLQGAVAHSDMPVETGPTLYLPHSHRYQAGYLAWRRSEFKEHFAASFVQLPLARGDAAFFNPALFHAAGTNRTSDVRRMANLLQISSAFGRAMESVDRERMSNAVYPALQRLRRAGAPEQGLRNAVAATAEGYSFPTNLDRDQPIGGLAPETQAETLWRALVEDWTPARLAEELAAWSARRRTA